MTKAELIEAVHDRTRRRAEGVIDMENVYVECLQELCEEMRWSWRKKYLTFATVAGTATYDLSSVSLVSGQTEDIEEIIAVYLVRAADDVPKLTFFDDPDDIVAAKNQTTQGEPTTWCLEPSAEDTIRLVDIPSAVWTIGVPYWAIPVPSEATATIPLLPKKHHGVLQKRMEAEIWASLPGEGVESPNYLKAAGTYQARLDRMKAKQSASLANERVWASTEEAVRST